MHNTPKTVPAFYDPEPVPKVSIIAPTTKPLSTPAPEFKIAKWPLKHFESTSSPYPKKVAFMRSCSRTPMPLDLDGSLDSLSDSSSSSSASMNLSEDSKIPKPISEPGCPGRGGYTLYKALDWNPKAYGKFKKYMHGLIDDHLDTTKCASTQSPILLKAVCDKALDEFPDLENYSNLWPVSDMIMTCLKYTSSHTQRKDREMALGKGRSKGRK
ncbi:hypothetical protein EDD22DRAFT_953845 [Suillus occidentalis]|nr:hypothetical protein EDD22DRAFT_953845 [Suillus occidentalis]